MASESKSEAPEAPYRLPELGDDERTALRAVLRGAVREHLVGVAREDAAVTAGMNRFVDLAIQAIGHAYQQASATLVRHAEDGFRHVFSGSPQPMWTYDRETLRFVAVNDAAVAHYGYTRDEFLAMTIADIRPPDDIPALHEDISLHVSLQSRVWRHVRKDGSIVVVEVQANDFVSNDRTLRLILATDVTERERNRERLRRTEDQLRQAQKLEAVGRLAGGVAHDFNNLLTVIQSYACMLEDQLEAGDPRRQDATEIRHATERAHGITRQLLTLSRKAAAAPRTIDLRQLVNDFLPMVRRLVGESVSVVAHCAEVPLVLADPTHLEQVLMNLAVNARDAMPSGGRLAIETRALDLDGEAAQARGLEPGRYVALAVTDTGVGMTAETKAQIFDPFFTTKEMGKGTGLGLSIVHGIVTQAGGTITVYSEPGHGTAFWIHLPAAKQAVEAAAQPAPPAASLELPPVGVLLVDDQPDVRAVAARILREAGCRVLEAATCEEARSACVAYEGSLEVVLSDVVLADGRGDALVAQLRELRPQLACVLMSGYPAGALATTSGPPPELLNKPFSPAELRAAIARVAEPAAASKPRPGAAERINVLVADDDELFRHALARALSRTGCEVVEATTGRGARAELEQRRFDVIVTDVNMPDGTGLDLLRAVRRVELDLPVIFMSGTSDVHVAAAAVEYGVFRYLVKPIEVDAIVKVVRHAARAHALARLRREAFAASAGVQAGAADRVGLEVRFEQALDRLWMAFQPIVDARTGAMFGIEALMRSDEPSMAIPPAILDAATQLGRLPQLGRKIRALSASAIADRRDEVALFVNLHPEDLLDAELIAEASPLTRIASRVVLEVTERASLQHTPLLVERIARLRALGFRLAIDDIGAGYSGLASFAELTPEIVKLDMSLVRDIHVSALKQRTVAALCNLCHEVDCVVVGEGVESVDERECLLSLGCDLLQGYLIARPARGRP